MITIIHGDNQVQSRQKLHDLTDQAKQAGQTVVALTGRLLTAAELETQLGGSSLFGGEKVIVIEGLHDLPPSKKRDELTGLVAQYGTTTQIILWEKKSFTATAWKKFPKAGNFEFKTSKVLFKWLESLSGRATGGSRINSATVTTPARASQTAQSLKLLHQALDQDGPVLAFTMLCRQVRLLLQIKDSGTAKVPPFGLNKLKSQAATFSLPQLLILHHQLLEIDFAQKTSATAFDLNQQLDLVVTTL